MKITKLAAFILLLAIIFACGKSESPAGIEKFQTEQNEKQLTQSDEYIESIQSLDSEIEDLKTLLYAKREQIDFLMQKKDSIQEGLKQVKISMDQVNTKKIDPGINGVNLKLDELKGQKENIQEQLNLQKQEILLAEKKVSLQEEEKAVYTSQRKILWDKGAPPTDFTKIDSLITGIDKQINDQKARLKYLNRNTADMDEQITNIDAQRNSLSTKIRSNYTAQKIYEEYSSEEKARLENQMASVDEELKSLLVEQEELNRQLSLQTGDKSYLQLKQNELDGNKMQEQATLENIAIENQQLETERAARNRKIMMVFIGIVIAGLLLFALYYIGKKRKSKKSKTLTT